MSGSEQRAVQLAAGADPVVDRRVPGAPIRQIAGAFYNLLGPEQNLRETLAGLAIGSVLLGLFFFMRSQRRRDEEFLRWLRESQAAIERGGARYHDSLITPDTKLTQYQVALSFLIVSFRVPSRLYIVGHGSSALVASLFTLISPLLGWWGVPWGPVYTLRAVWRNARGGVTRSVADCLAGTP